MSALLQKTNCISPHSRPLTLLVLVALASSCTTQPKSPRKLLADYQEKCVNRRSAPIASHFFGLIQEYDEQAYECAREPSGWRWLYVKELGSEYSSQKSRSQVLIKEESLDARLSNLLYTANSARMFQTDMHSFNSGDREKDMTNMQLVAGPRVDDQLCALHLTQMLALSWDLGQRVKEARDKYGKLSGKQNVRVDGLNSSHIQLARVLDSFGSYEHGHLSGKIYSLGAYEQCVTSQLELPANEQQQVVPMRYCWARLKTDTELDESLKSRRLLVEMEQSVLKVGICLPESCHSKSYPASKDLLQRLISDHVRLPENLFVRNELQLESVFCLVDEDSPFNRLGLAGIMFLCSAALWATLIVVASRWEPNLSTIESVNHKSRALLGCFGMRRIWREFMKVNEPSGLSSSVDFSKLIPIRILSTLIIICHHAFVYSFGNSANQLQVLRDLEPGPEFDLLLYSTLLVDLFLIFTAMLTSFKLVREMVDELQRQTARNPNEPVRLLPLFNKWLRLVTLRAFRIMPLYLLLFWFKKSIWIHLSNGPMWDKGLNKNTPTGCCLHSSPWWSPFMFNFDTENVFKKCAAIGWYVGVDLFNYAIIIPLIMLYASRPKLSIALSVGIVCICKSIQTKHINSLADAAFLWEVDSTQTHGQSSVHNSLSSIYVLPHYRLVFSFMGVFAGYYLYAYETQQAAAQSSSPDEIESVKTNRMIELKQYFTKKPFSTGAYKSLTIGLMTPLAIGLSCLFIYQRSIRIWFFHDDKTFILNTLQLAYLARLVSCVALTMISILVVTDWRNCKFLRYLSSPLWQRISKLSCLVYLVHLDLILAKPSLQTTTHLYSSWGYIYLFGASTFYSVLIAFALHLMVETPISLLVKQFSSRTEYQ